MSPFGPPFGQHNPVASLRAVGGTPWRIWHVLDRCNGPFLLSDTDETFGL